MTISNSKKETATMIILVAILFVLYIGFVFYCAYTFCNMARNAAATTEARK